MSETQGGFTWNELIAQLPSPHLLQTSQWAAVKERFGWQPSRFIWLQDDPQLKMKQVDDRDPLPGESLAAAAQILERSLPLGLRVFYVPKGPLLKDWSDDRVRQKVFADLESYTQKHQAIQLKIDPDLVLGVGIPGKKKSEENQLGGSICQELRDREWIFSKEQIQYRNTVLVDITKSEDAILAAMKSKTRYNIRLAGRKGVKVRPGTKEDLETLYQMYARTAVRADFTIRSEAYYQTIWNEFFPADHRTGVDPVAQPLIAEVEGDPVAGAVIFRFLDRAWYIHGMSLLEHSDKMPSYRIQWESMRWAKSQGCSVYDMWGAPDQFTPEDPMWGVYRFKSGFGGQVVRTMGAWDYPGRGFSYRLYHRVLPQILNLMRLFRDQFTEKQAAA